MVLIVGQKLYSIFQGEEKLMRDHRKTMNELVDAVNPQIVRLKPYILIWLKFY